MKRSVALLTIFVAIFLFSSAFLVSPTPARADSLDLANILSAVQKLIVAFSFVSPQSQQAQLSGAGSGLVAYYTFDDNVNDSAGSNNGTASGSPTYTDGKIGKAISLDGSSYANIASTPTPGSEITISAWIKPSSPSGTIIYRGDSSYRISYRFSVSSGKLRYAFSTSPGSNPDVTAISNGSIIVDGSAWTFVTTTYSSTDGSVKLYINGVADGTASRTGAINSTPAITNIGADNPAGNYFSGSIDDLRIYSRALTPSEITELYNYTGGGGTTPTNQSPTVS